jgi:hypothetical protein
MSTVHFRATLRRHQTGCLLWFVAVVCGFAVGVINAFLN